MVDNTSADSWDLRYSNGSRCPTRNGGELYYEVMGCGPPLVFLNNFFIVAPVWRNFTKALRENYTIVTYDLQNQGASAQRGEAHTFADHRDDLCDLLDHLGFADAYLVGTSISTLIARDMALAHPDRVRALVLTGPAFSPYGPLRLRLLLRDWLNRLEHGGAAAVFNYLYPVVFSDLFVEGGGRANYLGLREHFLALNSEAQIRASVSGALEADGDPGLLARVDTPTLLMIGDADYLWCERTVADALALFPRATGHVVPASGHMPFVEATERFESVVGDFLARTRAGSEPARLPG